jgi:hypothetical protein
MKPAIPTTITEEDPTDKKTRKALIAAFGERTVEAELLRRGWVTANVNSSVRNAKDFDLFAAKNGRLLQIRVKTCSQNEDIQYSVPKEQEIPLHGIAEIDFTVVVRMGADRSSDRFYIIPTRVVLEALSAWRTAALPTQKDTGQWVLRWRELQSGEDKPNYGFERKWQGYLNAWAALDEAAG